MGYMLADTFCWLVGHERKSRLNGASYHIYLGYYGTLLRWEQEAKSYSPWGPFLALCDGGPES